MNWRHVHRVWALGFSPRKQSLGVQTLCIAILLFAFSLNEARADCPAAPIADADDMVISFLSANGTQAAPGSLMPSTVKEGMLVYDEVNAALKLCDGTNWIGVGSGGSDTLAALSCASGEIAKYNGTAWACAADGNDGGASMTGAVMAFNASTCPAGWTEFTAARGRFLRGIDSTGSTTNDAAGLRAPGSMQEGSFVMHAGGGTGDLRVFNLLTSSLAGTNFDKPVSNGNAGFAGNYVQTSGASVAMGTWGAGNLDPNYVGVTRPKNVAVIFCQYAGSGGLGGGGGAATSVYFHATRTTNQSIASGTNIVIVGSTEVADAGGDNYNPATGEFTAPVSGYYQFDTWLTFDAMPANAIGQAAIYAGGSYLCASSESNAVAGSWRQVSCSGGKYLTAGQKATMQGFQSTGGALNVTGAQFNGALVGGGSDTLALLSCAAGEIAKYNGTVWACAADGGGSPGGNILGVSTSRSLNTVYQAATDIWVVASCTLSSGGNANGGVLAKVGATSTPATVISSDSSTFISGGAWVPYSGLSFPVKQGQYWKIEPWSTSPSCAIVEYPLTGGGADTLAALSCASGEIAKYNGTAWACAADGGGSGGTPVAFYAKRTSAVAHGTNPIPYQTEVLDTASAFNNGTGVFTAPSNGLYQFTWGSIGNTTTTGYRFVLRKNGTALHTVYSFSQAAADGTYTALLNAGETVTTSFTADNASTALFEDGGGYIYFTGHKIDGGGGGSSQWADVTSGLSYATGGAIVGGSTINASAVLQADSTTKGFLPPRMTTTQRDAIASPATGLMIFNTTAAQYQFWDGTAWTGLGGAGVPTGTIAAFALTSCPAGWTEYTAARGRFLRGIDNGAGNDPDGTRAPGATQADAFKSHQHYISGFGNGSDINGGPLADSGIRPASYLSTATGGTETRPKNVAVLFCQYSGSGGGGGSTTLAGLTDVDLSAVANGKVLTYNSTSGKWEAATGSSGTPASPTNSVQFNNAGVFGGDAALTWDNTNKRLGIGTTAPGALIDVVTTGTGTTVRSNNVGILRSNGSGRDVNLRLSDTAANSAEMGMLAGDLYFTNNGVEHLRIANSGNVGIGTTTPTNALLHLVGVSEASGVTDAGVKTATLRIDTSNVPVGAGGSLEFGISGTAAKYYAAIKGNALNASTNSIGDLTFLTRSAIADTALTERMRITSTGFVGIGTAAPNAKLAFGGALAPVNISGGAARTDARVLLYDNSADNWSGFGNDQSGNFWLKTGTTAAYNYFTMLNNGRVGIGTTGPGERLEVAESTGGRMIVSDGGGATRKGLLITSPSSTQTYARIDSFDYGAAGGVPLAINNIGLGNVGIGLSAPSAALHLAASTAARASLRVASGTAPTSPNDGDVWYDGTHLFMRIGSTSYQLDQQGGSVGDNLGNHVATQNLDLATYKLVGNGGSAGLEITSVGNVGIGTATPPYKLTVAGDIYANGGWLRSSGNTGWFNESYGGGWYMTDGTWIRNYNSKPVLLNAQLRADGQIQIYNTSPTIYLLDSDHRSAMIYNNDNLLYFLRGDGVGSAGWATYNGYWPLLLNLENNDATFGGNVYAFGYFHNSDERLKENIAEIDDGLEIVSKLRGVSYQWKHDHSPALGVIAQEVEKVIPSAVRTNENGDKTVEYDQLIGPLIEAVKELKVANDDLREEINALKRTASEAR